MLNLTNKKFKSHMNNRMIKTYYNDMKIKIFAYYAVKMKPITMYLIKVIVNHA